MALILNEKFLIYSPFAEYDSHVLLLLEFSVTFNFERVYCLNALHIGRKLFLGAKITPTIDNENEI